MVTSTAHADLDPIVATKLFVPKWRTGFVSRPRLLERLDHGLSRTLTLVSAPAGFGKTTLVAEWLAASAATPRLAAWVTLEPLDDELTRFWRYVIHAVQTVRPSLGRTAMSLLDKPRAPAIEHILAHLINELTMVEDELILVLDDFQVITSVEIHDAMTFFLDHLPPPVHLVIASRHDPPWPLARRRSRDDIIDLRASDLRFTRDEATSYLNDVMSLGLSDEDVSSLENRSEGWIAGLQLAALSLREHEDQRAFIDGFSGSNRFVVDYLVEEVLQRQTDDVQCFLLSTSILDRFCGALCDAVTGLDDGANTLATLERNNLFLIPLDDERRWYRYHHLFADGLRSRASRISLSEIPNRHRCASVWFDNQGHRQDAIQHAFAASDFAAAARLLEQTAISMLGSSQEATLYGWIGTLPDSVLQARPVLSVHAAFATFGRGELETAEAHLRNAEHWLEPLDHTRTPDGQEPQDMVVVDDRSFQSLPGIIAVGRAYLSGARGQVDESVNYAEQALELLPVTDHLWRGASAAMLGIGFQTLGTLGAAFTHFSSAMDHMKRAGDRRFQIAGTHVLADIRVAQGRLGDAQRLYERSLSAMESHGHPEWGSVDLYVGLSEISRERNDLDVATQRLLECEPFRDLAGPLETRHRWHTAMAGIYRAHGDYERAIDLLDEAERQFIPGPDPDLRPIASQRTRLWLAQGNVTAAWKWAAESGLSVDDDPSYLREFDHVTIARVLIARSRHDGISKDLDDARRLLRRLLAAAEKSERNGSVIEILVTLALAQQAHGNPTATGAALSRAIELAAPEGYARVFLDERIALREPLTNVLTQGTPAPYARRLLMSLSAPAGPIGLTEAVDSNRASVRLTPREVEIIRLIADGLRNQEIADQLFISLPTVKRHIANAYQKLDVRHRTEALARARELALV